MCFPGPNGRPLGPGTHIVGIEILHLNSYQISIMYYVYFLQSLKVKRFYIGVTEDLVTRLKKHNNGSSRSTAPYRPWKLIYSEEYSDKSEAYKREYYLKRPKGYLEKLEIIKYNQLAL